MKLLFISFRQKHFSIFQRKRNLKNKQFFVNLDDNIWAVFILLRRNRF